MVLLSDDKAAIKSTLLREVNSKIRTDVKLCGFVGIVRRKKTKRRYPHKKHTFKIIPIILLCFSLGCCCVAYRVRNK